jgi:N6-L-threonylcarbamoyladenine synthase
LTLDDIDAVAVANTPGLAGSLLVGLVAAKALCVARGLPLVAVNHLQAHIYACRLAAGENVFPCVGMIVSGGHTSLYRCRTPLEFDLLGGTIDDAAGEAFDKVASLLGLPFPGGPAIERAAQAGNPRAYAFPRSFIHEPDRLEFSFSGLKTAVRYAIADLQSYAQDAAATEAARRQSLDQIKAIELSAAQVADLAASFQAAVVDCLVAKAQAAMKQTGLNTLCVGGGVAANALFRTQLTQAMHAINVRLVIPPLDLCTDNAVMGAIAVERLNAGLTESLDLDIYPGLVREKPSTAR